MFCHSSIIQHTFISHIKRSLVYKLLLIHKRQLSRQHTCLFFLFLLFFPHWAQRDKEKIEDQQKKNVCSIKKNFLIKINSAHKELNVYLSTERSGCECAMAQTLKECISSTYHTRCTWRMIDDFMLLEQVDCRKWGGALVVGACVSV